MSLPLLQTDEKKKDNKENTNIDNYKLSSNSFLLNNDGKFTLDNYKSNHWYIKITSNNNT